MTWGVSLASVAAAVVVLHGTDPRPSPVNFVLGSRPLVFLGKISYSLYLWHLPVLAVVLARWPDIDTLTKAAIVIGVSVPLATVSYWFVERPLMSSRGRNALRAAATRRLTRQPAG
jgi:peptidoglycan/LPS O-acetylase OafA/YrhL